MDISKLMAHPIASETAAAIPGDADVTDLAELYCKLIAHGDYASHCRALAIEWHLRTAAQIAFHKPEVLRACHAMEAALESRQQAHNRILRHSR